MAGEALCNQKRESFETQKLVCAKIDEIVSKGSPYLHTKILDFTSILELRRSPTVHVPYLGFYISFYSTLRKCCLLLDSIRLHQRSSSAIHYHQVGQPQKRYIKAGHPAPPSQSPSPLHQNNLYQSSWYSVIT